MPPSLFQQAINRGDYVTALSLLDTRTPYGLDQFSPFYDLQDPTDSTGSPYVTRDTVFQPILIYPSGPSSTGTETFNHSTKGEELYASSGSWKLDDTAIRLLEDRLSRSLGETGIPVRPLEVRNSAEGRNIWRENWGPPAVNMGISPEQIAANSGGNVVPIYLVRGLGGYAGGNYVQDPGPTIATKYATMGDVVIEALAGYQGDTAGVILGSAPKPLGGGLSKDRARFRTSWQSQMGTVLHEALHGVAGLEHTPEEKMNPSVFGTRPEDRQEAINLVMGDPVGYGWGFTQDQNQTRPIAGTPSEPGPTTGTDIRQINFPISKETEMARNLDALRGTPKRGGIAGYAPGVTFEMIEKAVQLDAAERAGPDAEPAEKIVLGLSQRTPTSVVIPSAQERIQPTDTQPIISTAANVAAAASEDEANGDEDDQQIARAITNKTGIFSNPRMPITQRRELDKMSEGPGKINAANQLAKNIVSVGGSTPANLQLVGRIYTEFVSGKPGAPNFNDWSTTQGLQWDTAPLGTPGWGQLAGAAEETATVPNNQFVSGYSGEFGGEASSVPTPLVPTVPTISGMTMVYFRPAALGQDATAQMVPNNEVQAFLQRPENIAAGATTNRNEYPVPTGGLAATPGSRRVPGDPNTTFVNQQSDEFGRVSSVPTPLVPNVLDPSVPTPTATGMDAASQAAANYASLINSRNFVNQQSDEFGGGLSIGDWSPTVNGPNGPDGTEDDASILALEAQILAEDRATRGQTPFGEYMRSQGIGMGEGEARPFSRAGRFVSSQWDTIEKLFNLQSRYGAAAGTPGSEELAPTIGEFAPTITNRADASALGRNILSNYFGMDPDDRGLMGMSYERSYDPISGEIDTGGNIENLKSLLKYGLRGQYGPAGSQFLASRIQPLQQRFEIERPGGSFVDYFKNKFNLGL